MKVITVLIQSCLYTEQDFDKLILSNPRIVIMKLFKQRLICFIICFADGGRVGLRELPSVTTGMMGFCDRPGMTFFFQ